MNKDIYEIPMDSHVIDRAITRMLNIKLDDAPEDRYLHILKNKELPVKNIDDRDQFKLFYSKTQWAKLKRKN